MIYILFKKICSRKYKGYMFAVIVDNYYSGNIICYFLLYNIDTLTIVNTILIHCLKSV